MTEFNFWVNYPFKNLREKKKEPRKNFGGDTCWFICEEQKGFLCVK